MRALVSPNVPVQRRATAAEAHNDQPSNQQDSRARALDRDPTAATGCYASLSTPRSLKYREYFSPSNSADTQDSPSIRSATRSMPKYFKEVVPLASQTSP